MLMFVFGAGASYDSDPERQPHLHQALRDLDFRPPLAAGLFSPNNDLGKRIIARHPRAASLLMELRQATRRGDDVEEYLEQRALSVEQYPDIATQLLAFRIYLADLLREVPDRWLEECQGLTNYVQVLEQAHRWNSARAGTRSPISCVTFNYDRLIEEATAAVFGYRLDELDSYQSQAEIHVYKPHGSVGWYQAAKDADPLPDGAYHSPDLRQTFAVEHAARLQWRAEYASIRRDMSASDGTIWLPAVSIPIRRKSTFTMPAAHQAALVADLRRVTTVVAIGWRAREQHFLRLLEENLPGDDIRLVAVAESDVAARETIDNLWVTGRFSAYAVAGRGFTRFVEVPVDQYVRPDTFEGSSPLQFLHVLTGNQGVWTTRSPGPGLPPPEEPEAFSPWYVDL